LLHKYKKLIYCVVALLVLMVVTKLVTTIFKPFIIILLLIFFASPLNNGLEKLKLKNSKFRSAIALLIVNLATIVVVYFISSFILGHIVNFNIKAIEEPISELCKFLKVNPEILYKKIEAAYSNIVNSGFLRKGAVYTTEGIVIYLIGNITAYFILAEEKRDYNLLYKLLNKQIVEYGVKRVEYLNKFLKVEIGLVIFNTFEIILGFAILNIKNAVILGVICGVLDIMPYLGTSMVFIPLIIIKLLDKNYAVAIGLVLLYLLLAIIRQLLEARYLSKTLNLNPALILMSSYIGLKTLGTLGILVGPLYMVIVKEILTTEL